jgi:hypothetical protein
MAPTAPPSNTPPRPTPAPAPAPGISTDVPRLWPALPPQTRRLLAQELARLVGSMRTRLPSAAASGTEAIHAEHASAPR